MFVDFSSRTRFHWRMELGFITNFLPFSPEILGFTVKLADLVKGGRCPTSSTSRPPKSWVALSKSLEDEKKSHGKSYEHVDFSRFGNAYLFFSRPK